MPKDEIIVENLPLSDKHVKERTTSCWDSVPVISGINKLYDKYDATFLTMLGMQYFNQGTKVLVYLGSSDLFKSYYQLDPGKVQSI